MENKVALVRRTQGHAQHNNLHRAGTEFITLNENFAEPVWSGPSDPGRGFVVPEAIVLLLHCKLIWVISPGISSEF